jgi:hypothetical protein
MMPAIFVLDVEEFSPLVHYSKTRSELQVSGPTLGYWKISAESEINFSRKELGFNPAVWNGALTGGLIGRVALFDRNALTIVGEIS